MARVTHVKRAQQRYATKPVLDENGQQKQVPVMRRDGVTQKTTKSGRPVFLKLTERDLTQPKPMPKCGNCGKQIEVGMPYKWIEPHGRGQLVRCAECPTWQVWEYSNSLSARIAQITADSPEGDSSEDLQQWASDKAQEIRDLAEEKRESASNIEEGFGHETYQSQELNETADSLDQWADELEGVTIPELPEPEEEDCEDCGGTGTLQASDGEADGHQAVDEDCDTCGGSGRVTPEEPTDEQMDEWREEAIQAIQDVLDNSPV